MLKVKKKIKKIETFIEKIMGVSLGGQLGFLIDFGGLFFSL